MTFWNSTQELTRVSIVAQWLMIVLPILGAVCGGVKLIVSNRLDDVKAEKSRILEKQLHEAREALQGTQEKLSSLEAGQQPRRLTPQDAAALTAELSRFSKQRIQIAAHSGDHESLNFAFEIQKALMEAAWQAEGVSNSNFHTKPGIWIWYHPGSKAELAAKRLIALLKDFGYETSVMEGIADKELILLSTGRRKD